MLAQQAGSYREHAVSQSLRNHFSCVWVNRLHDETPFVVIPDGTIDLQWVGGKWRVAGPDRDPMTERFPAGTIVVGFRFHPGGASAWLGASASELCGQRVWLEDVLGRSGRDTYTESLPSGPVPLIATLEAVLTARAGFKPLPSPEIMRAYHALARGLPRQQHVVPWLKAELGLSERTLRRRFESAFGYGPKTLDRILRFQRYMASGSGFDRARISRRAAASGYADQSHLVRECRRLALCTPGNLP
jgi:AraC-like DNA-binding protein